MIGCVCTLEYEQECPMKTKTLWRIEVVCSEGAKNDLMPLLKTFKTMGDLGSTRAFNIEGWKDTYTFDGDGESHIKSISESQIMKTSQGTYQDEDWCTGCYNSPSLCTCDKETIAPAPQNEADGKTKCPVCGSDEVTITEHKGYVPVADSSEKVPFTETTIDCGKCHESIVGDQQVLEEAIKTAEKLSTKSILSRMKEMKISFPYVERVLRLRAGTLTKWEAGEPVSNAEFALLKIVRSHPELLRWADHEGWKDMVVTTIELGPEDYKAFVEALKEPSKPNPALQELFKKFQPPKESLGDLGYYKTSVNGTPVYVGPPVKVEDENPDHYKVNANGKSVYVGPPELRIKQVVVKDGRFVEGKQDFIPFEVGATNPPTDKQVEGPSMGCTVEAPPSCPLCEKPKAGTKCTFCDGSGLSKTQDYPGLTRTCDRCGGAGVFKTEVKDFTMTAVSFNADGISTDGTAPLSPEKELPDFNLTDLTVILNYIKANAAFVGNDIGVLSGGNKFDEAKTDARLARIQWACDHIQKHYVPRANHPTVAKQRESREPTIWAVDCGTCGKVYMTYEFYLHQLEHSDNRWVCPRCGDDASWDDATYEAGMNPEDGEGEDA